MAPALLGGLPSSLAKRSCASQLMGIWAVEPRTFGTFWGLVQDFGKDVLRAKMAEDAERAEHGHGNEEPERLSTLIDDVAVVPIGGPMTKHATSFQAIFGGTSTTQVREELAALAADPGVKAILLNIDSPGGTVAGSVELADDIAALRARGEKPIVTFYDGLGASAALWVGSQANVSLASRAAEVGSIGVYHTLYDESEAFERDGIKVHVINTGGVKGGGVPGSPIEKHHIASVQRSVDDTAELFIADVARGRGLSVDAVRKMADGDIHVASRALKLGLIDGVGTFDDAVAHARKLAAERKGGASQRQPVSPLLALATTSPGSSSTAASLASVGTSDLTQPALGIPDGNPPPSYTQEQPPSSAEREMDMGEQELLKELQAMRAEQAKANETFATGLKAVQDQAARAAADAAQVRKEQEDARAAALAAKRTALTAEFGHLPGVAATVAALPTVEALVAYESTLRAQRPGNAPARRAAAGQASTPSGKPLDPDNPLAAVVGMDVAGIVIRSPEEERTANATWLSDLQQRSHMPVGHLRRGGGA